MKLTLITFLLVGTTSFAGTTCKDRNGRTVTLQNGILSFQGLDSVGIPSGKEYSVIGSHYEQVPGGPSYSEYTGAYSNSRVLVRLSEVKNHTSAKVWNGTRAQGKAVFAGPCDNNSKATFISHILSGLGACYGNLNCSGATVAPNVSADECVLYGGLSWDDGSGCKNLN
jgi:hypothetical protein